MCSETGVSKISVDMSPVTKATEVVDSLQNIINVDSIIGEADGVCFEDVTCLVVGEATSLNMVGVVG